MDENPFFASIFLNREAMTDVVVSPVPGSISIFTLTIGSIANAQSPTAIVCHRFAI
jgi:hypothetical protein